ncbi:MAG: DNA-3-methyladenine glycosylase 2 family protein [Firmicutes bacterium]|nr:DNA-3-methyladenine glycosylase 2 family protein [Bacillota bacterium]
MKITYYDNRVELTDTNDFNITEILECGQCFRFTRSDEGTYRIIALDRVLDIRQTADKIIFSPCTAADFDSLWYNYFDLGTDYKKIKEIISKDDPVMQKAVEYAGGIRLLNQEPFETLISFIISQNNNIPRIKGIISRLSKAYGRAFDENDSFFPDLAALANVKNEDYMSLGTGFRAKYLCDCTKKLLNKEIDLSALSDMSAEDAKKELLKIKGVGPKVADCVLLFSLGKRDMYPVDVWVKRVTELLYFDGKDTPKEEISAFAAKKWGKYAGYAQQYLFYYARSEKLGV